MSNADDSALGTEVWGNRGVGIIRSISLELLKGDLPHIPTACGELHAQAASICLNHNGHSSGVELTISGDFSESVRVQWVHEIDAAMSNYWRDLAEAAEQGAVGIAMLLTRFLAGYTIVERSIKGTGIDWWLGTSDDPLFQRKARLEVSGIVRGTASQLNARVRAKMKQTKRSDSSGLDAFVVVVEFSKPESQVVRR